MAQPSIMTNKKQILFVDDDPNILSGIKRMLHSLRHAYEIRLCENGERALEMMSRQQADVVVSDMRMPVMDGAQLLSIIQQSFPHAIRIMLTGQADDASVLKTVTVAHQFLAKPCDSKRLKEVLDQAATLHDRLTDGHLKDLITGIGTLPSLPSIYARLQQKLRDPEASTDDIGAIIEQDIAMTAKLLQLVNSSFFGLYRKVDSPSRAVRLLGLDTVKVLVLGIQIFAELKPKRPFPSYVQLWEHSVTVAQFAKQIATASDNLDQVNNSFIAGLLHDIGRLLLMSLLDESYSTVISAAGENDTRIEVEEQRSLQATHADIGAYLVGLWGFNADIMQAVAFHHRPDQLPAATFSAALAVHLADHFYYQIDSNQASGCPPPVDQIYLEKCGLADRYEGWRALCQSMEPGDKG